MCQQDAPPIGKPFPDSSLMEILPAPFLHSLGRAMWLTWVHFDTDVVPPPHCHCSGIEVRFGAVFYCFLPVDNGLPRETVALTAVLTSLQGLPQPVRGEVKSALLLLYSSVTICAPWEQLQSQLVAMIVPRILHHYDALRSHPEVSWSGMLSGSTVGRRPGSQGWKQCPGRCQLVTCMAILPHLYLQCQEGCEAKCLLAHSAQGHILATATGWFHCQALLQVGLKVVGWMMKLHRMILVAPRTR